MTIACNSYCHYQLWEILAWEKDGWGEEENDTKVIVMIDQRRRIIVVKQRKRKSLAWGKKNYDTKKTSDLFI